MIIFYFPDKRIHQVFSGYGIVEEKNGTLHIDGKDTTTCAADVAWKYVQDQEMERDEHGWMYVQDADYYPEYVPPPTLEEQVATLTYLIGA